MRKHPYDVLVICCICMFGVLNLLAYQIYGINQEQKRQAEAVQEFKNSERNCLITALYHEARGEGKLGIEAVASVIYNRKSHPYFPESYCGITNQYKQFSYTLLDKPFGDDIETILKPSERKVYTLISNIANDMVNERFKPTLPPSVMWYTTHKVSNKWTKKKKVVAEIGKHRFYS